MKTMLIKSISAIRPSYFIAVYDNGEVVQLSSPSDKIPQNSSVRFIIHCEYLRSTAQGYGTYYNNKLFNSSNERIEDNTFIWEGFKCHIHEEESWGDIRTIWVRLVVDVEDKLGITETLEFENRWHDGYGFRELFTYLEDLTVLQSHTAVKFVRKLISDKDKYIKSLEQKIDELEKLNA